jgi:hypothetical protein
MLKPLLAWWRGEQQALKDSDQDKAPLEGKGVEPQLENSVR